MEVDEEGEDEVVVVEEAKQGEMRKQASSSLPKSSRKRVRAGTVTQTLVGSQVKGSSVQGSQAGVGTAVSPANPCWRCVRHKTVCIMPSGRARCENCWVKHYRCSLVPLKEVMGGKGGASGSQKAKTVEGSQMKGMLRKARKALTLGKSKSVSIHCHSTYIPELVKLEVLKWVWAASAVSALCTSREALRRSINTLCARLDTYDLEVWSILHERKTCAASVKELEEVLVAAELMDEEVELWKEKVRYDARRGAMTRQEVVVEESRDKGKGEGEDEEDEDEDEDEDKDEPVCSSGLSAKAKGKRLAK